MKPKESFILCPYYTKKYHEKYVKYGSKSFYSIIYYRFKNCIHLQSKLMLNK